MRKIARIEKDLESIKDGEYFSYVMGTIAPSSYFDGEVAYRISGIVYKKVDGKVWNTKVEGDPAAGYIAKEWHISDDHTTSDEESLIVKDAYGNILQDGDAVILIKDLKVKGSSLVIKKGTKVKNIRCIEGDHNIDCKIDGTSLQLKSEFLKKA